MQWKCRMALALGTTARTLPMENFSTKEMYPLQHAQPALDMSPTALSYSKPASVMAAL